MDIVILLFNGFEPLDAIGPYEILAQVPGVKVRLSRQNPGGSPMSLARCLSTSGHGAQT